MRQRGFTLLELLVVLAIVAMASAGVGFAMRDSGQAQLEREAQRLAALLESARARSQALGIPLRWRVTVSGSADNWWHALPLATQTAVRWY